VDTGGVEERWLTRWLPDSAMLACLISLRVTRTIKI